MDRREMLKLLGVAGVLGGSSLILSYLNRPASTQQSSGARTESGQRDTKSIEQKSSVDYEGLAGEVRYIIVRPEYALRHCNNAIKKKEIGKLAAKHGTESVLKALSNTMWYNPRERAPLRFDEFISWRRRFSAGNPSDFDVLIGCFSTGLDIREYIQETIEFAKKNGTFPGEILESLTDPVEYYNGGMGNSFKNPGKAAEMFYNMIVSGYLDGKIPYSPDSMFHDALPYHQNALQKIGRFGESGVIARAGSAPTLEGFLEELSPNPEVYQREFWRSVLFTRLMTNCILKYHDEQGRIRPFQNVIRLVGNEVFSEVFRTSLDGREILDGRTFVSSEGTVSEQGVVDAYVNDLFSLDSCWKHLLIENDARAFAEIYRTAYRPRSLKEVVLMGMIVGGVGAYNEMKAEREYQAALSAASGRAGDVLWNYNNPDMPQTLMRPPQPWTQDDSNVISRTVKPGTSGTATVTEREIGLSPEAFQQQQHQERINRDPPTRIVRFVESFGNRVLSPLAPRQ